MSRFFTKKSVAVILTTIILLFGFFNAVSAETSTTTATTTVSSFIGNIYSTTKSAVGVVANYGAGVANLPQYLFILGWLELIKTIWTFWLALFGGVFDIAIDFSIIHIRDLFGATSPLTSLWQMMRDLFNITFIFLLLYVAISQIIGSFGAKAKTTIVNIVISAVMINFSMFFTKVLIDAGNMVAISFYHGYGDSSMGLGVVSMSQRFLENFHLLSFIKDTTSITGQTNVLADQIGQLILMSGLMIFYLVSSMFLIGRTAMLLFLTVLSPIGFISQAIPGLGEYSKTWWKNLIDQILVAPMMMFVLLVVSKLLENNFLQSAVQTAYDASTGLTPPALNVAGYIYYFIVIMLLFKGLSGVKKMSGAVGEIAVKVGKITAVVGAAVATAGVGLAVGAGGAGAAAAAQAARAAGGGAARQAAARLAFSGKELLSNTGKFARGTFDKTGVTGTAQTAARGLIKDNLFKGVKNTTGIDLGKMEKSIEKSKKDTEKNLFEAADKAGPQKAIDTEKQLKAIKENIEQQAKISAQKEEAHKEAEKEAESAKKEFEQKEKALNKADASGDAGAFAQANKEYQAAKATLGFADDKVKQFTESHEQKIKETQKEIATQMGVDLEKLDKDLEENKTKIIEGTKKRNEFIRNVVQEGGFWNTFVVGQEERQKLADKMRAQKGKYNAEAKNVGKNVLKALKDAGIELPKDDESKEGGDKSKDGGDKKEGGDDKKKE